MERDGERERVRKEREKVRRESKQREGGRVKTRNMRLVCST
jgi:hypothetical protein